MKTYKGFYGTKEQYINWCIENVKFWSKAISEDFRMAFVEELDNAEQMLANEGFDWDEIEKIEIAAYN